MSAVLPQKANISIVVPVFREEKNVQSLYKRLLAVVEKLDYFDWHFVFVNDGSPDRSREVLRAMAKQDNRVKVIDFSRNFGKEIALTAGVHSCNSDAVICMDADLQHPPELIPQLVTAWQDGAEVVATIRKSIEKQPILRQLGSHLYYWLMGKLSGLEMVSQTTDFRLLDRKVVDAFRRLTERQRMFRGIIDWMGFKKTYVEFNAAAREDGEAVYSYRKLWALAVTSITSYSLLPLRLTGYLGILITFLSGLLLIVMLGNYFLAARIMFTPVAIVVVANTLLIGIVLMGIGLVALYIGTIHTEVINRPLYIVREYVNYSQEEIKRISSGHGLNQSETSDKWV